MPAPYLLIDGLPAEGLAGALAGDRGFAFGDGVFRTMRVRGGRVAAWSMHRDKLLDDAARIGLRVETPAFARLERDLADLAARHPESIARVTLTAGGGPRGYRRSPETAARIVLRGDPIEGPDPDPARPMAVRLCDLRLALQPRLAGIKHLNRLEQVLARAEWDDPGIDEGLMLDADGTVICGTLSNVFVMEGDRLLTPRIDRCGVAGVTRQRVLDWAAHHAVPVEACRIAPARLQAGVCVLLTNSVIGVRWVGTVDGAPTGGQPPMFEALREWLSHA